MKTEGLEKYIRTDLACESGRISPDMYRGARYEREERNVTVIERLHVTNSEGERETGKEKGHYITVSDLSLKDPLSDPARLGDLIAEELISLSRLTLNTEECGKVSVLAAGIGNSLITPDSLGPRCADKINPTRLLFSQNGKDLCSDTYQASEISVIKTGVAGQTGIESFEMIKGMSKTVSPDIIIVIDALAARSVSRLASTVQLSDTGLRPGNGVGNSRPFINTETAGCPVISIGVPTVVSSSTLVYGALDAAGMNDFPPSVRKVLDEGEDFFVSLNDIDIVIDHLSDVISYSINKAFGILR